MTLLLVLPQPLRPLVDDDDEDDDDDDDDDDEDDEDEEQDDELADELDDTDVDIGWWPLITVTSCCRTLTLTWPPAMYSSPQMAKSPAGGDEPLSVSGESDRYPACS